MSNKTIKINPELFNISGKKRDKKQKNNTSLKKPKTSAIKTELLKKIKQHRQSEQHKKQEAKSHESNYESEFEESMNYLQNLHNKRMHKKTLRKKMQNPAVSIELPNELSPYSIPPPTSITIDSSINEASDELKDTISGDDSLFANNEVPAYGCLKNSSLPTFREWKRKTQRNVEEPSIVIEGPPLESINTNEKQLQQIKDIYKKCDKKITKKKTKKYKLGKNNRTISVLIHNNKTRKNIQNEINELKQTKMSEIKNDLKKKGLIKVGCIAPNNILRTMYENAVLCGDVVNKSSENLIHNYMSGPPTTF
tara:strand:+ start:3667 stop:4593 length:927 start_codon:yes stop_codon:yes gene_type:complete